MCVDEAQGEMSQVKCAQTDHREEFQIKTEGMGKKQETPETCRQSQEIVQMLLNATEAKRRLKETLDLAMRGSLGTFTKAAAAKRSKEKQESRGLRHE